MLLPLILTTLGALGAPTAVDDPALGPPRPLLGALHLSSYGTLRAARLTSDGRLDTGAVVLQFVDAESGAPLPMSGLDYGASAWLWAGGTLQVGALPVEYKALASAVERSGDVRARAIVRLAFANAGAEPLVVPLAARLWAGGASGEVRPEPALPFVAGTSFAHEGALLLRDGRVVARWAGVEPQVQVSAAPATPDATACLLRWSIEVPAGETRFLEVALAGPPSTAIVEEPAVRAALAQWGFLSVEEQHLWQTQYRGQYVNFPGADPDLYRPLVAGVHALRMLGDAHSVIRVLTDRPNGLPPSDAAVPAQVLAVFTEWGLGEWSVDARAAAVASAAADGAGLPPARRLALAHGLARCVRLGDDAAQIEAVAQAIVQFVTEPARVDPWLDPERVRRDLAEVLRRAGRLEEIEKLPVLGWAEVDDPQSTAGVMLALRRALSAGELERVFPLFRELLDRVSPNGFAGMVPGGELDGRFPMGFMTLTRALLVDDHGDELHLLPALPGEFVPPRERFAPAWIPTVYGEIDMSFHRVGRDRLGGNVKVRRGAPQTPARMVFHLPIGLSYDKIYDRLGGTARKDGPTTLECTVDPKVARGLMFTVHLIEE